ncbi:MAG: efflux RND transporter permease subunit [Gammaproteobacteria bacterium]
MSESHGRWTDLFVRRPVLAVTIALLVAILGLFSFFSLKTREYPNLTNTVIKVSTTYSGASPQTVQSFITQPLGRVLGQTPDLNYLTSSSSQGTSTLTLYMKLNSSQAKALGNVQTEITQVSDQLPANSRAPVVTVSAGHQTSLMYMAFYSPHEAMSPEQITDYVIRNVQPLLQTVQGVSQARIIPGGSGGNGNTLAMRVWLKPEAMTAYGVTAAQVQQTLQTQNVITALGTTRNQLVAIPISSNLSAENVATFKHLVVKTVGTTPVYLDQVARVALGAESYTSNAYYDGNPAVLIGVDTTPSANSLDVAKGIEQQLKTVRKDLPTGLDFGLPFNSANFIHSAINEVIITIAITLAVVLLVIFLFLGSLRALVIPAVAIPLSILGAGILMNAFGYSLNLLTFLAFVLAIGLVVDDAIVVVENVHRHVDEGENGFVAAVKSARELTLPIIVMSTTLVAVFLPVAFSGGLTSILFTEFAFTIVFSVLTSMLLALTLSPVMCSWLLRPTPEHGLTHFLETNYGRLRGFYERSLASFMRYPVVGLVFTVAILASLFFLFSSVTSELSPPENQGVVFSVGTASPDISPTALTRDSKQVLGIMDRFPEKNHTFMATGFAPGSAGTNGMFAGMNVSQKKYTASELVAPLQQALGGVPGLHLSVATPPPLPGSTSILPIDFVIKASSGTYKQLNQVAQKVLSKAMASGNFAFLQKDLKIDQPQYNLIVNRKLAGSLGITMNDIASVLQPLLSGGWINHFTMQDYSYQVIPEVPDASRATLNDLSRYHVQAANGTLVPLSTLVHFKKSTIPESLPQFNRIKSTTLSGIPAPGVSLGQALAYLKTITQQIAPKNYNIDYSGNSRQFEKQGHTFLFAIVLALILVYLLMSAQFNSFRDSLIVMLTIPMSVFGALIFMSLGFATLNIYTEIALITLLGLITKQGILVVQFANQLQQEEGLGKLEAVEKAASVRLRPILMTTLAMVFGVVPLIMASGDGAPPRHQLGLVIATGMAVGALFSLYIVPVMYYYIARDHAKHSAEEENKARELSRLAEEH